MLTDWLPPWGGWDDAICLVFDGGVHPAALVEDVVRQEREIRAAEFCTVEQVRERAADFTARRVEAARRQPRPRRAGVHRVRAVGGAGRDGRPTG